MQSGFWHGEYQFLNWQIKVDRFIWNQCFGTSCNTNKRDSSSESGKKVDYQVSSAAFYYAFGKKSRFDLQT